MNDRQKKLLEKNGIKPSSPTSDKQRIKELEKVIKEQDDALIELASIIEEMTAND